LKERYLVRALKVALDDGFEAQLPVLQEMRALYPDDKEMLFGLGDAEFHSGKYDSAAVHFRAALAIDPEMERALQHLSWTLLQQDRFDEALAVSERWVQATHAGEAYEYLAIANLRLGRPDAAMKVLEEARQRDPKNPKLLARAAHVLYATHRPYEALEKVDKADRMGSKDPLALLDIGRMRSMVLYPYLGRFDDSAKWLGQARAAALETFNDSTTAINLTVAEAVLGYWAHQDARKTLGELQALQTARKKFLSEDYWRSVATFHLILGDTAQAGTLLRAHSKDLTPGRRAALGIFQAAAAGECARAAALLQSTRASKLLLNSAEDPVSFVLARCQLEAGAYDAAIASLRTIVDREIYFADSAAIIPVAWFFLGEAYERKGDVARAVSSYERLLELWKNGDADLYCRKEARLRLDRLAGIRSM
jgi:tetratricopeptide (TPR) repeat protein